MNCNMTGEQELLARQILQYSRQRVSRTIPLLLPAVYAMGEQVRKEPGPISTDGVNLWFHPEQVLQDFRQETDSVAEQILHVILHCLLGHLRLRESFADKELFDAVADCKVSRFLSELSCGLGSGSWWNITAWTNCGSRTLHQICGNLDEDGRSELMGICHHLRVDDHGLWKRPPNDGKGRAGGQGEEIDAPDWSHIREELRANAAGGKRRGDLAGALKMAAEPAEENQISYADFLRRFAAPRERVLLDPDTIDSRWYHLGLEHFGSIPLLEPCELSEPLVGDDLVIALDTSSSCSGETCRRFLRETCNLLRDISTGASSFRILLLQCDAQIQQELLLQLTEDLEDLLEKFEPQGFGGTDFCPVFERVEELRQDGTLPRVRGLIYLSDGYGSFPEEQPDYPVAFLLEDDEDGWSDPSIPEWVEALKICGEDFELLEDV